MSICFPGSGPPFSLRGRAPFFRPFGGGARALRGHILRLLRQGRRNGGTVRCMPSESGGERAALSLGKTLFIAEYKEI